MPLLQSRAKSGQYFGEECYIGTELKCSGQFYIQLNPFYPNHVQCMQNSFLPCIKHEIKQMAHFFHLQPTFAPPPPFPLQPTFHLMNIW